MVNVLFKHNGFEIAGELQLTTVDAVKMKKEIDKTYARISGASAGRGLRGKRTKRSTPDRRPTRLRY